jgi:hypothetical protein
MKEGNMAEKVMYVCHPILPKCIRVTVPEEKPAETVKKAEEKPVEAAKKEDDVKQAQAESIFHNEEFWRAFNSVKQTGYPSR